MKLVSDFVVLFTFEKEYKLYSLVEDCLVFNSNRRDSENKYGALIDVIPLKRTSKFIEIWEKYLSVYDADTILIVNSKNIKTSSIIEAKMVFISYQGNIIRNFYQVAAPVTRLLFMDDKFGILLNNGDLIYDIWNKISTNEELVSENTGFGMESKIMDVIYANGPKIIGLLLSKNMPVQDFLLTYLTPILILLFFYFS